MMARILIYDLNGTRLINPSDTVGCAKRATLNDLRPMRPLFRKAIRKRTDEEGIKVQIPFKNQPHIIMTPERRHATIRAAYNTSH